METEPSAGRRFVRLAALVGVTGYVGVLVAAGGVGTGPVRQAEIGAATLDEFNAWFDPGPARFPLAASRWIPQGLTKLSEDVLIASYYDRCYKEWKDGKLVWSDTSQDECKTEADPTTRNSIVVLFSRTTGARIKTFNLNHTGHVGGIAMTKDYLWVVNRHGNEPSVNGQERGTLWGYPRSELGKADFAFIKPTRKRTDMPAWSYAYAQGETLWVGQWAKYGTDNCCTMFQYSVRSDGTLGGILDQRRTPTAAQGVAVTSSTIVWSQSRGRPYASNLIVWPKSVAYVWNDGVGNWVDAPSMSQGLVYAGGELQVLFESCTQAYNGTEDGEAAIDITCSVWNGIAPPYPWTGG